MESAEEKEKRNFRLEIWLPLFVGIFSFFIGLLYFLPLEALGRELILRLFREGASVEFRKIDFTFWGGYEITDVKISYERDEAKSELFIPIIKGRFSPWALIFQNKLFLKAELGSFEVRQALWEIRFGELKGELKIAHMTKNVDLYQGEIQLEGNSIIFQYNKEVPILNEKIELPINFLELKAKLDQGFWQIRKGLIESRLVKAEIQGKIPVAAQALLDLELIFEPKEELYQKYQDKGLKEILTNFKLLQTDGKVKLKLNGTLAKPEIKPITQS